MTPPTITILCRSADPSSDPPHAPHLDVVPVGALLQEEVHGGTQIRPFCENTIHPTLHPPFSEHAPLDGAGVAAPLRVRAQDIDGVFGVEPPAVVLAVRPAPHRPHHQRPLQPAAQLRQGARERRQRQQRRLHRQRIQQPLRPHQELLQVRACMIILGVYAYWHNSISHWKCLKHFSCDVNS